MELIPHVAPDPIVELLNEVEELVLVRHPDPWGSDSVTECRLCGDWEGHRKDCPMPALRKWLRAA